MMLLSQPASLLSAHSLKAAKCFARPVSTGEAQLRVAQSAQAQARAVGFLWSKRAAVIPSASSAAGSPSKSPISISLADGLSYAAVLGSLVYALLVAQVRLAMLCKQVAAPLLPARHARSRTGYKSQPCPEVSLQTLRHCMSKSLSS